MTDEAKYAAPTAAADVPATDDPGAYLSPTWFLDFEVPELAAWAEETASGAASQTDKAIKLHYGVRDQIRYDPYAMDLRAETFKASHVLAAGRGFCVQKGALLAAAARQQGIPARLGYADVRNHLATERLLEILETDLFIYHGFVDLYLDGRWVKSTPAFNIELCEKFGVLPLEFDGRTDSIFHPYDAEGRKHMEYVNQRGVFADLPYDAFVAELRRTYPKYFALHGPGGDFYAEAEAEAEAEHEPDG